MNKKLILIPIILGVILLYLSVSSPTLENKLPKQEKVSIKTEFKLTEKQLQQQEAGHLKLDKSKLSEKEKKFILLNLDSEIIAEIENPLALLMLANTTKAREDGYGSIPPIKFDNPQAIKLKEALDNPQKFPERISSMIAAKQFEWQRFQDDQRYRQQYLDSPEPARAKAHGLKQLPKLKMQTPFFQRVVQGKSIKLKFIGVPKSPYTVTTYDAGQFANNLTTQTKMANSGGYIEFDFFATSGVIADVNISCAGPRSSNVVRALIHVEFNRDDL